VLAAEVAAEKEAEQELQDLRYIVLVTTFKSIVTAGHCAAHSDVRSVHRSLIRHLQNVCCIFCLACCLTW
jgi:hypothetical protein